MMYTAVLAYFITKDRRIISEPLVRADRPNTLCGRKHQVISPHRVSLNIQRHATKHLPRRRKSGGEISSRNLCQEIPDKEDGVEVLSGGGVPGEGEVTGRTVHRALWKQQRVTSTSHTRSSAKRSNVFQSYEFSIVESLQA